MVNVIVKYGLIIGLSVFTGGAAYKFFLSDTKKETPTSPLSISLPISDLEHISIEEGTRLLIEDADNNGVPEKLLKIEGFEAKYDKNGNLEGKVKVNGKEYEVTEKSTSSWER